MLPLCSDLVQLVVIIVSFRTRSATRIASPFRSATWPDRLATFSPCTATGTTMAMKASAARASASVKPAQPRLAQRVPDNVGLNFIVQLISALRDPNRFTRVLLDHNALRARLIDKSVRLKSQHRQVRVVVAILLIQCGLPGQQRHISHIYF